MTENDYLDAHWKGSLLRQLSGGPISVNALTARFGDVSPDAVRNFIASLRRTGILLRPSLSERYDIAELTPIGEQVCSMLEERPPGETSSPSSTVTSPCRRRDAV